MDDKQIAKEIRTAIKLGDVEKVATLIGSDKAWLEMMTPFGTWLHVAASRGKLEIVKRLVALGADVNRNGGVSGGGPLNRAASDGHIDIVRYLLACGAKMDVSEPERNPLFGAIYGGHIAVARLLIGSGIDTHVKYTGESMKGMDALAFAHERGQSDIVELLTSSGTEAALATEIRPVTSCKGHAGIIRHFEEHHGPVQDLALTEIVPGDPPVTIYVIRQSDHSRWLTLFTVGLSDRPMIMPEGSEKYRYAELLMYLPPDWPLSFEAFADPDNFWPVQWLRKVAYYPHLNETRLGGNCLIITNDEPPKPLSPNAGFTCMMLLHDPNVDGSRMKCEDGREIFFYVLLPLYTEERDLEMKRGLGTLLKLFDQNVGPHVVNVGRVNVATGR